MQKVHHDVHYRPSPWVVKVAGLERNIVRRGSLDLMWESSFEAPAVLRVLGGRTPESLRDRLAHEATAARRISPAPRRIVAESQGILGGPT